jgi:PAS domain S-box-containing protein
MSRLFIRFILPVLVLLAGGALMAQWLMARAEREMRADMIQKVQLLAQGMNPEYIQSLAGTDDDTHKPEYARVKRQLTVVRSAYPLCRFIYLAGRKADGSVYFFVDSEPAGSKDASVPGQPYPEVSEAFRRVFDTKASTTEGPLPDRWGVWVSALVPITDPLTGEVLAVLGADMDARDWNGMKIRAALPAALLMLALAILWFLGAILLDRRARLEAAAPKWMRHTEPVLVVSVGLTLSLAGALLAYTIVSRHQDEMFGKLAEHQGGAVVERLQNVRDLQLKSLAHFYTARDRITSAEFQEFAQSLTRTPSITVWGWAPVVPAADRERFEAQAQVDEFPDFKIWEIGPKGKQNPGARETYYPILQIAPASQGRVLVGADLAGDPLRRAVVEEIIATGLTSGSEPVILMTEAGQQKGMMFLRPVYTRDQSRRLRGFVGASVRMESLVRAGAAPDRLPLVELFLLREGAAPESFATTWRGAPPPAGRTATRPVFAFGKVFLVTVHAGSEFGRRDPMQAAGLALFSGLLLTGTLATLVRFILRRRERLEQLVTERTAELRLSEESYRNQFAESSAVMLLINPEDGALIDANAAAVNFYGYPKERLLALRISDINTRGAAETKQISEFVLKGWRNRFEFQHRVADGSLRDVAVAASAIQYGGRTVLHSIIQDITEQKRVTLELEAAHHDVQERIKELRCLYAVTKLTTESRGSIDELLRAAASLIPPGWQYPEITRARITCDGEEFAAPDFRATAWILSNDILVAGRPVGKIEVCYLEEKPPAEEGPFMKEERILLSNLATQIGAAIEHKRAEKKLRQLSSIIEQAPLSVIITDLAGVMEYVNPKFCAVTGYTREEVIGQNARMLKSGEETPEVYRDLWAIVTSNLVWSGEIKNRKKNGEIYLETVVIAPLTGEDGRATHYVALKDDITAQKRFEAETNALLEKEREISQMKSQFVSVASHEFRTPLAAAVGSLDLLERHAARLTEAKRLELLARIKTSLGRLTTIMDDVLQLSRADSGRVKVNRMNVDLPQFAQDIIKQVEAGDHQQHRFVFLRTGGPDTVPTDTSLLNHILSNLVGNAVRYSPAGTQISVTLEQGDTAFTFTIADEGIGIPEAEREKIFEPFVRGSNVGQIGGTGLGLNIVKRYVELLGGRIEVLPVASGTTFRVTIPLQPPPA